MEKLTDKIKKKYGELKEYASGLANNKEALKALGATVFTISTIFGGADIASAKQHTPDSSSNIEHLSNSSPEKLLSELAAITGYNETNSYDFSTNSGINNWIKDIMNKTSKMSENHEKFLESGTSFMVIDGFYKSSKAFAGYSPSLNSIIIDKNIFQAYKNACDNPLQSMKEKLYIAEINRLIKHEAMHAVTAQKLNLSRLNKESAIVGQAAFEIEVRVKVGVEAFELGKDDWASFKSLVPDTAQKIEDLAKKSGIKIGEEIKDKSFEMQLSKLLVRSFDSDLTSSSYSTPNLTAADAYKRFHAGMLVSGKIGNGRMSLSPSQIIEKCDLSGIINPKELLEMSLPTKKELKDIVRDIGKPFSIDKIPTLEKASSWFSSIATSLKGSSKA